MYHQIPLTALPTRTGAYAVIFHGGAPVELRTDRDRPPVLFSVVIQCRPQPDPSDQRRFTVNSTYYAFEILDLDQHELLVYHWHPEGISQVVEPHLHLSPRIPSVPVATRTFTRSIDTFRDSRMLL